MQELTERQGMVLQFIADHIEERGFPPTLREIGGHMDIASTNGVNDHLLALERKGWLVKMGHTSRALRLSRKARELCLGEVAEVEIEERVRLAKIVLEECTEGHQDSKNKEVRNVVGYYVNSALAILNGEELEDV
jgi:repressor LexA